MPYVEPTAADWERLRKALSDELAALCSEVDEERLVDVVREWLPGVDVAE